MPILFMFCSSTGKLSNTVMPKWRHVTLMAINCGRSDHGVCKDALRLGALGLTTRPLSPSAAITALKAMGASSSKCTLARRPDEKLSPSPWGPLKPSETLPRAGLEASGTATMAANAETACTDAHQQVVTYDLLAGHSLARDLVCAKVRCADRGTSAQLRVSPRPS